MAKLTTISGSFGLLRETSDCVRFDRNDCSLILFLIAALTKLMTWLTALLPILLPAALPALPALPVSGSPLRRRCDSRRRPRSVFRIASSSSIRLADVENSTISFHLSKKGI